MEITPTVITERWNDIEAKYIHDVGREDFISVLSVNETHMEGVRNNTPNGVLEIKKWHSMKKSRNLETKRAEKRNTQW
jgi:hypothetical protein